MNQVRTSATHSRRTERGAAHQEEEKGGILNLRIPSSSRGNFIIALATADRRKYGRGERGEAMSLDVMKGKMRKVRLELNRMSCDIHKINDYILEPHTVLYMYTYIFHENSFTKFRFPKRK